MQQQKVYCTFSMHVVQRLTNHTCKQLNNGKSVSYSASYFLYYRSDICFMMEGCAMYKVILYICVVIVVIYIPTFNIYYGTMNIHENHDKYV